MLKSQAQCWSWSAWWKAFLSGHRRRKEQLYTDDSSWTRAWPWGSVATPGRRLHLYTIHPGPGSSCRWRRWGIWGPQPVALLWSTEVEYEAGLSGMPGRRASCGAMKQWDPGPLLQISSRKTWLRKWTWKIYLKCSFEMTKVLYGWWTSILLIFQFFRSKHVFDLQSEWDVVIFPPSD